MSREEDGDKPRRAAHVWGARGVRLRSLTASLLLLCSLLGMVRIAAAHPHVWIDTVATFVFARGKVVSVRLAWTFDEDFSDTLLHAVQGTKRQGRLDERQIKHLYDHDFINLRTQQYFIHLYVGGKRLPIREVSDFTADLSGRAGDLSVHGALPDPGGPRRNRPGAQCL